MKQLLAGIVILLVIGVAGFLYRNTLEHPIQPVGTAPVACTLEAKVCPDGSSVGRSGPDCAFTACAYPNVELSSVHAAFAVPAGYSASEATTSDATLLAAYEKAATGGADTIAVHDYAVPAGKTATSTMLASTVFQSSGTQPTSLSQFTTKIINAKTFYCVTLERFEGQVHTACYLPRATDVLRFEVLERDVDWTNPKLNIDALAEHHRVLQHARNVQLQ
jgi:hypothetical protein